MSDSLSHRVWKTNSEIMVQIYFEVSFYIVNNIFECCAANLLT